VRQVLDASALLAVLRDEPGAESVDLEGALVSTVNWTEVAQRLAPLGIAPSVLTARAVASGLVLVPFDVDQAERAAALWASTRTARLSLGDRACLALGQVAGAVVVTADRAWAELDVGVTVVVVR
jgi:PIN domain nuclease of toxin-antitoxin system